MYRDIKKNAQLSEYGIAIYGVNPKIKIAINSVINAYFLLSCFFTVKKISINPASIRNKLITFKDFKKKVYIWII